MSGSAGDNAAMTNLFDHQAILTLCRGNQDAVDLIEGVWRLVDVWDDAVDMDHTEGEQAVNDAMWFALFDMKRNPVFLAHPFLEPMFQVVILNWQVANLMEKRAIGDDLVVAYTLRCSPYDFFVAVILAVAGRQAALDAVAYFRASQNADTFEAFKAKRS